MAYREISVGDAAVVSVQDTNDPRVYKSAVLTVKGASIRLVPGEGADPTNTPEFGQDVFAGAGTSIQGGGNIRLARMRAFTGGTATVGIDLQV